jgi:sigma-E factor negative regulatory protein RseA
MTAADTLNESMSAVMDGEANEMDLARILRAVKDDPSLRLQWMQHHQQRDAMSAQPQLRIDISQRVQMALAEDPQQYSRRHPLMGLAVAASVTLAVVFGGQQLLNSPTVTPLAQLPGGVVQIQGASPVQASYGVPISAEPVKASKRAGVATNQALYEQLARERFYRYSVEHAQATAALQPNHLIPYARVPEHIE